MVVDDYKYLQGELKREETNKTINLIALKSVLCEAEYSPTTTNLVDILVEKLSMNNNSIKYYQKKLQESLVAKDEVTQNDN